MAAGSKHKYSNEVEKANWDIYDVFKKGNSFLSTVFIKLFQHCEG